MIKILMEEKEIIDFCEVLKERATSDDSTYLETVKDIIKDVKNNKDIALEKYTKKFDNPNFNIKNIEVTKDEMKKGYLSLDEKTKTLLKKAKDRIYDYHMHQVRKTFTYTEIEGETLGQRISALNRVGIYVPGGKASYPSTVLMNAVPAIVAGVKEIVMVTPDSGEINPLVLACAYLCDVTNLYRVGGAQAIAAMAYGTESIKRVDKIVGPGNIFVALAKKEVYGAVGIDSIAGPSEILIVADDKSNPKFLAPDFLSQAEHDELASSVLITTSLDVAQKTKEEINILYEKSIRKNILAKSLKNYCRIIVLDSLEKCIELSNYIAPEHLELAIDDANSYLDKVENAGAIFLGYYTPEALGDYLAGPNHVLPTNQTSRFFSPLGVDDFIKKSSIISFTKEALSNHIDDVAKFATLEGLQMHAESILARRK